jgi:hypothetical protein
MLQDSDQWEGHILWITYTRHRATHTHTRIYDHNNLGLNVKRKHNKRKHVWSKISRQKRKDDLTTRIYDIWSREWKKEKKEKRKYLGMPSKKYIRERNISLYFR